MAISNESSRSIPGLGIALAVLLVACAGLLYFSWPQATSNEGQAAFGRLVAVSQSARSIAATRLAGGEADMAALEAAATSIRSQWQGLNASAGDRASLGSLAAAGGEMDNLLDGIDGFVTTAPALERVDAAADRLQRLTPQLFASARGLFAAMAPGDVAFNQPFSTWLEQSVTSMQGALAGRSPTQSPADFLAGLQANEAALANIVGGIAGASGGLGIRSAAQQADPVDVDTSLRLLTEVQNAVGGIVAEAQSLSAAGDAFRKIDGGALALAQRFQNSRPPAADRDTGWAQWLLLGLLGLSLLLLLALLVGFMRAQTLSKAADVHAEQNERNQQAILRLLDELSNLADGDLTVRATVTEDITGAIADSINYAIEALRELVITVNDSSILVDAAAKQSEATAHHMVRASETQVKQAVAASNSMEQMSASVSEVSGNAERCSDVARHAVEISHKGGEAVRRTIQGMNTIRETIQDTSKRIKRLGESSQEIGNIVELIEEIADQTNILALNASIEASRAGEASRGFAVVADEVQKLAERSTAATRKIEVLVSTIQSDTNEAVVSMERSTTDVVGGALLAENAGAALEEIEQVSHQIASLVHNISGSAREQNVAAAAITRNMDVLRDVSAKTKQSTTATSSSISKLSELASQLRKTVSGFKLPPDGKRSGAAAHEMQMGNTPSSLSGQAHGDASDDEFDAVARDLAQRQEAVGDLR